MGQRCSGLGNTIRSGNEKGANGKTSVQAQIDFLKQHKIHIHPSC